MALSGASTRTPQEVGAMESPPRPPEPPPPEASPEPPPEPQRPEPPKKRPLPQPNPWLLMGAGVELAAVVGVLALLGWWLDGRYGTQPFLLLLGLLVGVVGGIYNLWRLAKRFF